MRSTLQRGGRVDFFGSVLDVPAERRFADLASVEAYVRAVLALDGVRRAWPGVRPPRIRERAGAGRAHYERREPARDGVIALPIAGLAEQRWAARETVVLHELAHHLAWADAGAQAHGADFCGTLVLLYRLALAPQAALLLRAALDGAGVPVAEPAGAA